ncbi:MAG: CHAT domain-containing protein [Saprospiraceae bacterium]
MSRSEIQQLIVTGRMKEALSILGQVLPGHHQNTLILLQGRLNGLESKENMGIISGSDANIERNRITNSVVGLLDELPEDEGSPPMTNNTTGLNSITNNTLTSNGSSSTSHSSKQKTILFAAANPSDQARMQTDVELRTIKSEMKQGSKREAWHFLPAQTAVRITELMRSFKSKPTIVHFAGHGEEGGIIISTDNNEGLTLNDGTMKRLFRPLKENTELVLLNNCYAANQAKMLSTFGITVIGHNMPVGDAAASSFSKGFYLGLSEGMTYEDAFNDGVTAVLAENASYAEGIEVWKDGERLEW